MDPEPGRDLVLLLFPSTTTRRSLLSLLRVGTLVSGLAMLANLEHTEARKKRKNKRRKKKRKKNRCNGSVNGGASFSDEEALRQMINTFRNTNGGLPPLARQEQLTSAAVAHSRDMATRCFFEHVNPDGLDPFERMNAAGYAGAPLAENIYKGSGNLGSAAEAFDAWKHSPGHRANMLDSRATEIGIGTALDSAGFMIWTNVFGRVRP